MVEKFLFHHRWTFGVVSKPLSMGGVTATSYAINGVSTLVTVNGITNGLGAGVFGGSIGCVISTAFESIFIWRQYKLDRISGKEAFTLTGITFASNIVAWQSFLSHP